ncbi:protein kinase-like protein, putative [Trypanosoma cruzi marinkellei]|uniref:Protein kinase-like protein, putative n=1 Tax=Trypanosoma cruzi marinkellei TaxID=85056 RepID=K2LYT5_TRYCR|nr:protein kinase-like protein, putative [Trypanosoma cruzi marinkellei]
MAGRSIPPSGLVKAVVGVTQASRLDTKKAFWTISTTEVLCARMHSWQSAFDCYEFLRKRHLPIADEAVMSLLFRLQIAVKGNGASASTALESLSLSSFFEAESRRQRNGEKGSNLIFKSINTDGVSHSPPSPLAFLLHSTQYQPTLRPLYHRLRFIARSMAHSTGETSVVVENDHHGSKSVRSYQALFSDLLPILLAPCVIVNLSLWHNLRKRRWEDALRTIHNLHFYSLLKPYTRELQKVRLKSDTKSILDAVSHDVCYKACIDPPSLVSLMDELLLRWESYWDALKGTTEAQRVVSGGLHSFSSFHGAEAILDNEATVSFRVENDKNSVEQTLKENASSPLAMLSELEKSSLEVLHFAALVSLYRECKEEDELQEELEIFHRLMEATTRIADFSVCRRVALEWANAYEGGVPPSERRRVLPSISTEQLVLSRLILRAPSCEIVLQVLDEWPFIFCDHSCALEEGGMKILIRKKIPTTMRCQEVIFALGTRLSPLTFLEEIVNKRLSASSEVLEKRVREVVRDFLHRGNLHDAAENFWMCQAHLELATLCGMRGPSYSDGELALILREYLSQRLSVREKKNFISGLFRRVGEGKYKVFIDAICILDEEEVDCCKRVVTKHTCALSLLLQVMVSWVTEDQQLGDAAVLLRHIVCVLEEKNSESIEHELDKPEQRIHSSLHFGWTTQEVMNLFFEAVACLGFLTNDKAAHERAEADTAMQWLRLLSEIPSSLCDEQTLVVWLFWTMRALVEWEKSSNSSFTSSTVAEAIKESVLAAVRNLSLSLEKCGEDAVLPPMLLNWLASYTGMPWGDATAWIAKHAGVEASQRRRFLFIRLPFGHATFDSSTDASSRRRLLSSIERELQKETLYRCGGLGQDAPHGDGSLEEKLQGLFKTIRVTLLRAWKTRAFALCSSGEINPNMTDNFLPVPSCVPDYKRKGFLRNRSRAKDDIALFSLQELVGCLLEEASLKQDKATNKET